MWVYLWNDTWLPNKNTVAYYPLDSTNTVNDLSWNWYNFTNSWASFWTYDNVNCVYFNGSSYLYRDYINWVATDNTKTVSVWVKSSTIPWANNFKCFVWFFDNSWAWWTLQIGDKWKLEQIWTNIYSSATLSWTHLCGVWDGSTLYLYANWVLASSSSMPTLWTPTRWKFSLWAGYINSVEYNYTWYLSNVILEDKARTAQEVSDYYNSTKANYWL